MAISFPSSPTTNQTYTVGVKTWIWNGYAWDLQLANTSSVIDLTQAAFNKANSAGSYANGAFVQANAAFTNSNLAYSHAEAAFAKANTGTTALDVNSEIIAFTIAFS